ncbi:MAG: hypothetical protein ACOC6B_04275 [Thermodesulfobacteriota bacterium]
MEAWNAGMAGKEGMNRRKGELMKKGRKVPSCLSKESCKACQMDKGSAEVCDVLANSIITCCGIAHHCVL